jgi:CubicO group peptidase (beta-lactamase class C family)
MKPVRCVTLVTLAAGLAGAVPLAAQRTASPRSTDPRRGLDTYITQLMREWKVPGLAVAVVRGDSMVFAKGYGVRRLGDPTPVDPNTVFAIGSSSKAFTGAAVGMLVDEGKVT